MAWRDTPLYRTLVTGEPRRYALWAPVWVNWLASITTGAVLLGSYLFAGWYGLGAVFIVAMVWHVWQRIRQGYWEL